MSNFRRPVVAGLFYPKDREELWETLESICGVRKEKYNPKAILSPHAGYIYSGRVACGLFSSIKIKKTAILIGPNHRSVGHPLALYNGEIWETPLGNVSINTEISDKLAMHPLFSYDNIAHAYEHSIEVQIPFLQYISEGRISIVPICVGDIGYNEAVEAGKVLADVLEGRDAFIVISSDMSHYVPDEVARKEDGVLIRAMENMNTEELYTKAITYGISMCGLLPAVIGIEASKLLGAERGVLVDYATSGEVTGDYESVVGYCSMVFV